MNINVHQAHIDKGHPNSTRFCAVAHAVRDRISGEIEVDPEWGIKVDGTKYSVPRCVIDRMEAYDETGEMDPFSFELEYDLEEVLV